MKASSAVCFSVALANTRAFDDNSAIRGRSLCRAVDKIVVDKARRRLTLMGRQRVVRSYRISLGENGRTPAGRYAVAGRNPKSPFHLALRLAPGAGALACRRQPAAARHARLARPARHRPEGQRLDHRRHRRRQR
ncbi:MAG: L,D-transpeptidase [Rhodocyclaceae bacterium]|nr:L,D-transpeptidase [Rhodocyclaceae bacterium]